MKKLHISLMFSKLVVTKPLITIIALMHNFIVKFAQILEIYKKFAGNRVNENGNRPHCGVVPKFSDLEVIALSATAEAFGFDSENYLFKRLHAEKGDSLPNLITRRQYNQRRKLTAILGEEIRKDMAMAMDAKRMFSASTPSLSRSAKMPGPNAALWAKMIGSGLRNGVIAHPKASTTMDINFTPSAG